VNEKMSVPKNNFERNFCTCVWQVILILTISEKLVLDIGKNIIGKKLNYFRYVHFRILVEK